MVDGSILNDIGPKLMTPLTHVKELSVIVVTTH
jgi:hypothetical protein